MPAKRKSNRSFTRYHTCKGQGHQNKIKLKTALVIHHCKSGEYLTISSRKLSFLDNTTICLLLFYLKIRSRPPKQNQSLIDFIMPVCWESKQRIKRFFNFSEILTYESPPLTLKMGIRSKESNQILNFTYCYIHGSLVKIHLRGLVDRKLVEAPPSNFIAGRPKAALLFYSLVILDVVFRYLSLSLLYINTKVGKIDV